MTTTKETRFIRSFITMDDRGREQTIDEYWTSSVSVDVDGRRLEQTGLKEFTTPVGEPVNEVGPGEYTTINGQRLQATRSTMS